jgi:hypothetical protein
MEVLRDFCTRETFLRSVPLLPTREPAGTLASLARSRLRGSQAGRAASNRGHDLAARKKLPAPTDVEYVTSLGNKEG